MESCCCSVTRMVLPDWDISNVIFRSTNKQATDKESASHENPFNHFPADRTRQDDDKTSLIFGSWRQPLYSSRVTIPDYVEVKNNVVYIGEFYLQSFSLAEESDAIVSSFQADYTNGKVDVWNLWVNEAFHNYLLGKPN